MKTLHFVLITLVSGAIAGVILGLINQAIVEPFIDKAISIETQRHIARGETVDIAQQSQYRIWQKGGEVVAAATYGISLSALFGIVFVYSRRSLLPGFSNKKKALFLAAIMFIVIFLIPALKYPANPPAVGNPATIYYREMLYVGFIAVSGFSALALALSYRRLQTYFSQKPAWLIVPLIYAIIMISAYIAFPPNPDKVTIPSNLITSFRIASVSTVGIFWVVLGMIVGLLWDKFKLHEVNRISPSSSSDAFVS